MVDLILERIDAVPAAVALRHGDRCWTYAQLGEAAYGVVGELRAGGVRRGDFVPLLMTGGPASPIGMLASMIAGAVFVPLHADWPRERVRTTLHRLRPPMVLTDHEPRQQGGGGPRVVRVDPGRRGVAGLRDEPGEQPRDELRVRVGAADLAYGFFTSGSTGEPKCALNLHAGLANRFRVMTRRFGTGHVVLQNSPHVFDSSLWQLLWPLTVGDTVVQPDHEGLDLVRTVRTIAAHGVTMTDMVPSVFGGLVEVLRAQPSLVADLASLRFLLIGGEEINPKAVHAFRAMLPRVRVINTYGPTEASIGFVFHEVRDADGDDIPLGSAIDGTAAVVLTEQGRIAGPGEVGEINAAGVCLGAGYLGDDRLTARSFVPNPFPQVPGDRLYRTGDLGHVGPDGLLRFAGRRDHQVKIGGVRIEPVEVEAAILAHPAVGEAKVVAVGAEQSRALVCFVVLEAGVETVLPAAGAPSWLADHARRLLPSPSVPRRFVVLDRLPRTPNGKTDRAALAALADPRREPGTGVGTGTGTGVGGGGATDHGPATDDGRAADDGPRRRDLTAGEAVVARLWAELLGPGDHAPDSDFFAEGGTSLLAYQLALRLTARFGTPVTARDVAAAPTVQELAELAQGRRRRDRPAPRTEALVRADAVLPASIRRTTGARPRSGPEPGSPGPLGHVLLTGGTGFIGRQLLVDLLQRTDATVSVLVRPGPDGTGAQRLGAVLERASVAGSDDGVAPWGPDRVRVVEGDLRQPRLALSDRAFGALADDVDVVLHAGAHVNLVSGYRALRAANVGGVQELLRLAGAGRAKRLVQLSTLGVIPRRPGARIPESAGPGLQLPPDGYSQSKWAAEQLLAQARERGIASTVIRLGEVTANSRTGRADERSVIVTLLRVCADLGLRPVTRAVTDWTPVDLIGEVMVRALAAGGLPEGAVHLVAPTPVPLARLLERLSAATGAPAVDHATFHRALRRTTTVSPAAAALSALLPQPEDTGADGDPLTGVFHDPGQAYQLSRGLDLLDRYAAKVVEPDDALLDAVIAQLVAGGRSGASDGADLVSVRPLGAVPDHPRS